MRQQDKTHCPYGHEYTPENTIIGPSRKRPNGKTYRGARICRMCAAGRDYPVDKEKVLRAYKKHRRSHIEAGLCIMCASPAANGCNRCERHRQQRIAKRNAAAANKPAVIARRRKQAGLCRKCEERSVEEHLCVSHLALYRQETAEYMKAWKLSHPMGEGEKQRYRDIRNEWRRQKKQNDASYAMMERIRRRITRAVSTPFRKHGKTTELIGCSVPDLMAHLESQFLPGMTWENRNFWHIDHKRPCASFSLSDPVQQRECFHYTNLQPLWAKQNLEKSAKWPVAA